MSDTPARFRFCSPGLDIEFEGHPDFVAAQLVHFKGQIEAELQRVTNTPADTPASTGAAATPTPVAPQPAAVATPVAALAAAGPVTLDQFYRSARTRKGRGALQDSILLFAFFLREHRGKDEFSIDNLTACFSLVGVAPPSSLANTLGVMRRTQKLFDTGSRRGLYQLTEKGASHVRGLIDS